MRANIPTTCENGDHNWNFCKLTGTGLQKWGPSQQNGDRWHLYDFSSLFLQV